MNYYTLVAPGDVDVAGDLVEPSRWHITGWRTKDEREDGERLFAATPTETGQAVESLIRAGCYQVVMDDSRVSRF